MANARRILGCQSAHDGGKLQAARLLMVIYASALVASKLPVQLLSSRWYLVDAERSRLQAFQNQQQLISQPGLRRRLASERRQRLMQLPAGPGRHRATAAKAKGRRSAAR